MWNIDVATIYLLATKRQIDVYNRVFNLWVTLYFQEVQQNIQKDNYKRWSKVKNVQTYSTFRNKQIYESINQSINQSIKLLLYLQKRWKYRSSHPEVFLEKDVLKICSKFTWEHLCWSAISVKLVCNFIEITFQHGCSPVNLLHIFRAPFLGTPLGGCFWK